MNHLSELQFSEYVDSATLAVDETAISEHLAGCSACQSRVTEYEAERRMMSSALLIEDVAVIPELVMPKFSKPIGFREFALANVATGLAFWGVQFLWKTLFGELVVNAFSWIASIYIPNVYGLLVSSTLQFFQEGTTMMETYLDFILLTLVVMAFASIAFYYRRSQAVLGVCLLVLVGGTALTPQSASALERRLGEGTLTVEASEIIDDTLILAGETLIVDGVIKGDLVALGQRIVINGTVEGNLIALGDNITIAGNIGGTTISAGERVELDGASVGRDFWGAGNSVTLSDDTRVANNASMAAEGVWVAGSVGRDIFSFAENVELSGEVGADVEVFGYTLDLLNTSAIQGTVRFHSGEEDNLNRSPGSTVGGEVEFIAMGSERRTANKYTTGKFYFQELVYLVSAFLIGLALFWLFPRLRDVSLAGGVEGLKTAGLGLIALVSMPIIAVLFAITIIGLPFTVVGLFGWIVLLYFSKIVLAWVMGDMMLRATDKSGSLPLTLLAGLVVLMIATNLPVFGGVISFLFMIVGMGLLVQSVLDYISRLDAER
jgi:hypothetical protein